MGVNHYKSSINVPFSIAMLNCHALLFLLRKKDHKINYIKNDHLLIRSICETNQPSLAITGNHWPSLAITQNKGESQPFPLVSSRGALVESPRILRTGLHGEKSVFETPRREFQASYDAIGDVLAIQFDENHRSTIPRCCGFVLAPQLKCYGEQL